MSIRSPSSSTTSPASPQRPQKKRQRPDSTKNTSAVRCECSELRHRGGWPAAPMLKPCASAMWTCWSGLSDTPPPMMVKFSLASEPGVCASMKAVLHARSSP